MLRSQRLRHQGFLVASLILPQFLLAAGSQAQSTWRPKAAPPSPSSPPPPALPPHIYYAGFYDLWFERTPVPEPPLPSQPRATTLSGLNLATTLDSLLARLDATTPQTESSPFPLKISEPAATSSQTTAAEGRIDWAHGFTGGMAIRRADLSLFNEAFLQHELNVQDGRAHEAAHVLTGPSMAYRFSWDGVNFVTLGVSYLTLRSVDRQPALPGAAEQDWQRVTTTTLPFDVGYARQGNLGKGVWVAGSVFSVARVKVEVEYRNPLDRRYDYAFEFSGLGLGAALHAGYRLPVWRILSLSAGGRYDLLGTAKLGIDGLDWLWARPDGGLERAAVDLSGPSLNFGIELGG